MDPLLKKATSLNKKQREDYEKNLMPFYRTRNPIHMKSGKGVWFEDINGKKYLDFTTQMFACYLGLGNEEIAEVIYETAKTMTTVNPHMHTDLRYSLVQPTTSVWSLIQSPLEKVSVPECLWRE